MESKTKVGLEEAGFEPQVSPLAHFQDDYGLGDGDGTDDESEEGDEMGSCETEDLDDGDSSDV